MGRAGALAATCTIVSELGARIGLPGVDVARVATALRAVEWGPLRLYDLLVGGATSRAAVLALGIVPYAQARLYLWLGQAVLGRVWPRAQRAPSRRRVLGLTTGLALMQSVGFARFLESVAGAVAEPGAAFVIRTAVLVTGASLALGWCTEALVQPEEERESEWMERERATPARSDGELRDTGNRPQLSEGVAPDLPSSHVPLGVGVRTAR